jgi:hypothetical protein
MRFETLFQLRDLEHIMHIGELIWQLQLVCHYKVLEIAVNS